MDNQTAQETLREMLVVYGETKATVYHALKQLPLNEITAYMWGNGCRHITELADVLTRRKMNASLGL